VRELASTDGLAPHNSDTVRALKAKHPSPPNNLCLPAPPSDDLVAAPMATENEERKAIESFRPGSAGGPDGLRPSYLRTLIGLAAVEAGVRLLVTLTKFVNVVLEGGVPEFARSMFFGASFCALTKKDSDIRPSSSVGIRHQRETARGAECS